MTSGLETEQALHFAAGGPKTGNNCLQR